VPKTIMKRFTVLSLALLAIVLGACSQQQESSSKHTGTAHAEPAKTEKIKNNIKLSKSTGVVRNKVSFTVNQLEPNQPYQLKWTEVEGRYKLKDAHQFIGADYAVKEKQILQGKSDENGGWRGSFTVPVGFGGDHTIYVTSGNKKIGQANFYVNPSFSISPKSGAVGSEITIKAEGIGWGTYESNWQLTYDNKFTGMLSAVSTNGTAEAKIRAAGPFGKHTLTIWHGYLGFPYVNHQQAPNSYLPVPSFTFNVTDGKPEAKDHVESVPEAADGGAKMAKLKQQPGVNVTLDKRAGTVGEPVQLKASGLPKDKDIDLIWNTIAGSRITKAGFSKKTAKLATVHTDSNGALSASFKVPNDLGGIPHLIELKLGGKSYGQAYLRVLPSIVDISPKSGPVGTNIKITINGGGWTEFDNAYYLTYDNAYVGYMCAFNSQGTVTFTVKAFGEKGYHLIDLYPGIYKGKQKQPDIYDIPQLTYLKDHPGSAMPAIRLGFTVE